MSEDRFRKFFYDVRPIRLREPLAAVLGAFENDGDIVEFSYVDVVRAAGHACPSVSGAYLCCQEALEALYPAEIPLRGGIEITVLGKPDEGALGVMSQVFTFITGAAAETGFKGLGGRFARKELLRFEAVEEGHDEPSFRFRRADTGAAVLVRFYPWLIPFPEESGQRLAALMGPAVSGAADDGTRQEFQELWLEKIRAMIIERKEIGIWLKVEAA